VIYRRDEKNIDISKKITFMTQKLSFQEKQPGGILFAKI
jgi:hypothetical protein